MRGAPDHVLECGTARNVQVQLVPLSADAHACQDGPVRLLETPDGRRLAYSEGQLNGRLVSGGNGDDCVEVAVTDQTIHVRDSKDTTRPHSAIGHDEWARFIRYTAES